MPIQSSATYLLVGRIRNQQGESLSGLTIRAHTLNEQLRNVFLSQATTDRDGRYSIRFTWTRPESRERESVGPDVYILVFAGDEQIGRSPLRRNVGQQASISLRVELPTPAEPEEPALSVSGVVRLFADNHVVRALT